MTVPVVLKSLVVFGHDFSHFFGVFCGLVCIWVSEAFDGIVQFALFVVVGPCFADVFAFCCVDC